MSRSATDDVDRARLYAAISRAEEIVIAEYLSGAPLDQCVRKARMIYENLWHTITPQDARRNKTEDVAAEQGAAPVLQDAG